MHNREGSSGTTLLALNRKVMDSDGFPILSLSSFRIPSKHGGENRKETIIPPCGHAKSFQGAGRSTGLPRLPRLPFAHLSGQRSWLRSSVLLLPAPLDLGERPTAIA